MARRIRKSRIDKLDANIFGSLYKAKRPIAVKQLAKRVDVSWQTANKHVQKMQQLNILDVNKQIRKTNVIINKQFLSNIKKKRKLI